jgi:hypothetical protein
MIGFHEVIAQTFDVSRGAKEPAPAMPLQESAPVYEYA